MINIRDLDLRFYAVISLLVLWAALTFSIALTEITFVCALICWLGWHIQLKKGKGTLFGMSSPNVGETSIAQQNKACPQKFDWVFWTPLAIFFLLVLVSFFTSEYPKQSFKGLLKIAKPLLVFVMAIDLFRDSGSQKKFDAIFMATFLLVTIDCSIQYAFGKDLLRGFAAEQSGAGIRLAGPFGNFAKMATYLVLVIPVLGLRFWGYFTRPELRKRSFYMLALALTGCLLLYLTRCRGPVVALVLSLGILFIYKQWFRALGIVIVLCLAVLVALPRNVLIHQNAQGKEQSVGERFQLWRRALDVIKAKPLTGTGINTYNVAHGKYDTEGRKNLIPIQGNSTLVRKNQDGSVSFITGDKVLTSDESQTNVHINAKRFNLFKSPEGKYYIYNDLAVLGYYAHNGYLQLTAEIGIPGLLFFIFFLGIFFKRSLQSLRRVRGSPDEFIQLGLLTGLLAFLIYAATDNNLQSPPSLMMFWYLAGVLTAQQLKVGRVRD